MITCGIDVAKDKLDIVTQDKDSAIKNHTIITNDEKAIKKFFKKFQTPSSFKIVLESTGKYHRMCHKTLSQMGFPVMVVNPYQSRHFAKAMNLLCKTDKVDATVLCQCAEALPFEVTSVPTDFEIELQELQRHVDDLTNSRQQLSNQRRTATAFVAKSLDRSIKALDKEIDVCMIEISRKIKEDPRSKRKYDIILSVPGLAHKTACTLICFGRELGKISNKAISALFGLAPMNADSGKFRGTRRIQGGRHDIRHHLYMPTLGSSTQHNPRLKGFYNGLVARGKPKKVALTACMHKIVTWVNTLITKDVMWNSSLYETKEAQL